MGQKICGSEVVVVVFGWGVEVEVEGLLDIESRGFDLRLRTRAIMSTAIRMVTMPDIINSRFRLDHGDQKR